MNDSTKKAIADKLRVYCDRYESQNKAANSLRGVSSATVSQMLNGNWGLITNQMWRNVATQIGWKEYSWNEAETGNYKELSTYYTVAKERSMVMAVTGDAGTGKSFTAQSFEQENKNVFVLRCNDYWNKKTFLMELSALIGLDVRGYTIAEMMQDIIWELKSKEKPLLILDEADKLQDSLLYFFITIYNALEDQCGLLLQATDFLEKRLKGGVNKNAKGFPEIWSRLGRKCVHLNGVTADDVRNICLANGIESEKEIEMVVLDCDSDFRRAKRKIQAITAKKENQPTKSPTGGLKEEA